MKKEIIRTSWPRVSWAGDKRGWRVDARKTGTDLREQFRMKRAEALKLASDIAADYAATGSRGEALSDELRYMALKGEEMLQEYGKTVLQACEYYRDYLKARQTAQDSALVSVLAQAWYEDKASGKTKKLREETLRGLKGASETIKAAFPTQRILDITTADVRTYLDKQDVGLRRRFNLCSLFSQFFNWCISQEHITVNPCDKIEIVVEDKEVSIFSPMQAEALLRLCETRFPAYVLYHAISLFAGLRPEEAQFLQWEQIHLEERTITVIAETSKVNETHNVHIEDTLYAWLMAYKPAELKGYVTPQTNFKNITLQIHVAAGFRGTLIKTVKGEKIKTLHNESKEEWPVDVMRHSYGSYWLAKHGNRNQLAEYMCNSLQIIKKHYKKVVSKSHTAAYWLVAPAPAVASPDDTSEAVGAEQAAA